MPVFHHFQGQLSTIFARDFIDAAQRFPEVPRRTPLEIEALDLMHELAGRDDIQLSMELEGMFVFFRFFLAPKADESPIVGDIQFLHNHQILHARTSFIDFDEPELRRHLLRLWLCPPNGRALPEIFAERYGSVDIGHRGGIRVAGVEPVIPFQPDYGSLS